MITHPLAFQKRPVEVPWTCDQRGDCCKKFPTVVMTAEERDVILNSVGPEVEAILKWRPDPTPGFVQLKAQPCPLLAADGSCSVYDVRPYNCRRFMCGRVGDEAWEVNPDGSCHNLTARLAQSRPFRRYVELVQRRAGRWALAHGWKP